MKTILAALWLILTSFAGDAQHTLNIKCKFEGGNFNDTITVNFRKATSPYNILETHTVPYSSNGNAQVSTSLVGPMFMSIIADGYVESWSKGPFKLTANGAIDFTHSPLMTYGGNATRNLEGEYSFYAGDINHDGNVDLIDIELMETNITNFTYSKDCDFNRDGNVDLMDMPFIETNVLQFISEVKPN